ncbi:MAG: hypothetical protein AAF483_19455 [Planctomycetota bacterium]
MKTTSIAYTMVASILLMQSSVNAIDDAPEQLLPYCDSLGMKATDAQWAEVETKLQRFQKAIESRLDKLPYEKPAEMATTSMLTSLPQAPAGEHDSWGRARHIAMKTPPKDCYIHTGAVILNGNMTRRVSQSELAGNGPYRPEISVGGYINKSVVIINGAAELEGYIYDSIVIALGPIRMESYIYNSLVVSCYKGEGFAVDVEQGYVNQAIVVGKSIRPGSARQCTLVGATDTDDNRGAVIRDLDLVADLIASLGPDQVDAPPVLRPVKPTGPNSAALLQTLLDTEEQTKIDQLADILSEFRLQSGQVEQLIEAAEAATSDARRNALLHTIRLSRDEKGREYLKEKLTSSSIAQRINFMHTLHNPAPFDVPLLVAIYKSYEPNEDTYQMRINDLGEQFMDTMTRNWEDLVADWNPSEEFGFFDRENSRNISERREKDAEHARHILLRWLVTNGERDNHRINAWKSALTAVSSWPKYNVSQSIRSQLAEELLATSDDPDFREKAVRALCVNQMEPVLFLDEDEPEQVRLAAIEIMELRATTQWNSYSTARYSTLQGYQKVLTDLAEYEDSKAVREAATKVAWKFERMSAKNK